MAKRKRSLSSDIDSPASMYSTRSSARKSLNLNKDTIRGHLIRDSVTPTTEGTVQSTDYQNSPSSSRTSSNIVEAAPRRIVILHYATQPSTVKPTGTARIEDAPASPATAKVSLDATPERPGRNRKPTQKAAELAANSNSKLFKTVGTKQARNDDADSVGESHVSVIEHVLSDDDATEPVSPTRKTTRTTTRRDTAKRTPSSEPTAKEGEEHSIQPATEPDTLETTTIRPRRRKQKQNPKQPEEASANIYRSGDARRSRSSKKTPAIKANTFLPKSTSPATPPEESARTSDKAANDKAEASPSSHKEQENPPPLPKSPAQTTQKRKHPSRDAKEPADLIKATPSNPSTQPPIPHKVTRIKFKPLQATLTSALSGYTSLPCNLSCLDDSDVFYIWVKVCVEHEELADELCMLEEGSDADKSVKARVLRGRLNGVLMEFCVCGKSRGGRGKREVK